MTSDIAIPRSGTVAELDRMYAWADVARQVASMAESLARTSFVPSSMRGKPAECTACILAGDEVGLKPMAALRSIDIIDNKPVINAMGMRAIVQSQGHELWLEESTMTRAVMCGIRKGSDRVQRSEWTIERAKQAGLTSKKNWTTHPNAMLVARATAEICRLVAADALLAMPYSAEEIRDSIPDATTQQPDEDAATETRTFRRDPILMPPPDDLGDTVQAELADTDWPETAEVPQ